MKISFVMEKLGVYDSNKGYGRILFKAEPHVKKLSAFVQEMEQNVKDRRQKFNEQKTHAIEVNVKRENKSDLLSPAELLCLATILLEKKRRDDSQQSSQVFRALANEFGGFEVLELLQNKERLTEDNLVFFERNSSQAKEIVPLVMSLTPKIDALEMLVLFKLSKRMTDAERVLLFKFLNDCDESKLHVNVKLLCLLKQHKLLIDNLVSLLTDAKDIIFVHQIIDTLISANSGLLTPANVAKTLQLNHPYYFSKLLKVLPVTQEQFDNLLEVEGTLDKSTWSEDIIKQFNIAGWELKPWLKLILTPTVHSFEIASAIQKFKEIKISPDLLVLSLSHVFKYPHASRNFAEAVSIISEAGLADKELNILCGVIPNPVPLAKAIVALRKEYSYREETLDVVRAYPKHAFGLALGLIFFDKVNAPDSGARKFMLQHPECAEMTTRILEYLRENNLCQESITLAVCQAKISQVAFLNLLRAMNKASLLNQPNLKNLLTKIGFIKTLASAVNCLANADKLDQCNFNSLIIDPVNSLYLAQNLGGKPYPKSLKLLTDTGARSFVNIHEKAVILAQGQMQGRFFPVMTKEQELSFKKATGKTGSAAQNESLIKIASYCGNDSLEREAEHHIGKTAYLSRPGN
ncbi:hypothetical protein TUM19329_32610 [Legionella antarctica]|uniref:Uncharacterized protein n=1 Tax=Legionella antarctica TaxID=2708020 RepID=A0A6F8T9R3_9GAMM|nr:hypothetical protein [Legionella antarctica]BCA96900.1 hypothetical protein TUM19329_32610 [Legionella antarctica]